MENKNYYPLRVGSHSSVIVSDTDPGRTPYGGEAGKMDDIKHYGGHLIAESIPPELAKQIVDAYNYVHGCTSDKNKACIGGCMCCQSKGLASSKGLPEKSDDMPKEETASLEVIHISYSAIKDLKGFESIIIGGNRITKISHDGYVLNTSKGYEYISEKGLSTEVTVAFIPVKTAQPFTKDKENSPERDTIDFQINFIRNKIRVKDIPDREKETFQRILENLQSIQYAEGRLKSDERTKAEEDIGLFTKVPNSPFSIDDQIKWLDSFKETSIDATIIYYIKENLKAIQRWNESPVYHGEVDVEKVIKDCLSYMKKTFSYNSVYSPGEAHTTYQNAEAALGMLQAFKEKRDTPHNVGNKHPMSWSDDLKEMDKKQKQYNDFTKSKQEDEVSRDLNKPTGHIGTELHSKGESYEVPLKDGKPEKISSDQWTPEQVKEWMMKNPPNLVIKKREITMEERDALRRTVVGDLPDVAGKYQIATAIINAIEEVLKLRGL